MQKEIAAAVGISDGPLSRELSRNTGDQGYCLEAAHALAIKRRVSAKKHTQSDERHLPIIKKGLNLGRSPENIACRMNPARGVHQVCMLMGLFSRQRQPPPSTAGVISIFNVDLSCANPYFFPNLPYGLAHRRFAVYVSLCIGVRVRQPPQLKEKH